MKITVRYFASLREKAQRSEETLELTPGSVPEEIYRQLAERHGFLLSPGEVKFAVNEDYVSGSHVLAPGDELVFIPPVAGG